MSILIQLCRWSLPAALFVWSASLSAQTDLRGSNLAAGAVYASNSATALSGTIGQPIIGTVIAPGRVTSQGFWFPRASYAASLDNPVTGDERLNLSCSPNPVAKSAGIRINTPHNGFVSLSLHDLLGREVRALLRDEPTSGQLTLELDTDQLRNGHYTLVLTNGNDRSSLSVHIVR